MFLRKVEYIAFYPVSDAAETAFFRKQIDARHVSAEKQ